MSWGKIGKKLLGHGVKVLGGALAGPVGLAAAAGSILAEELGTDPTPAAVAKGLVDLGPDGASEKLREIEANREVELARLTQATIESVNETMRAETKAEHWPSYSWRPWVGFWWPLTIVAVYVVLPLVGRPVPDVPEWIWMGWAAILGVATWDRGKQKRGQEPFGLGGALGKVAGALLSK